MLGDGRSQIGLPQLLKRAHPELIDVATRKLQAINAAYVAIARERRL